MSADRGQLARELAEAKAMAADCQTQLEQRKMEARQALQREAMVVRELAMTKDYISVLEQRVSV